MRLLRTVYNEEIRPKLHPGQQSEMQQMLAWLADAVTDSTITQTLRQTLLDTHRRRLDQDVEEDADEADVVPSKPNPTPLMMVLNPANYTPGTTNWDNVWQLLENEEWASTLAWTWPTNVPGPCGYSAIHLAVNKVDKFARNPDEKQAGTEKQILCLRRIFAAAISQGCHINAKFGASGNTILHMAVTNSNLAVLRAVAWASEEVARRSEEARRSGERTHVAADGHPDWAAQNNDGLSPLGFWLFKHVGTPTGLHNLKQTSEQIAEVLKEGLRQIEWSEEDLQQHEEDMMERVRHLKRARARQIAPPGATRSRRIFSRPLTPPRHSAPPRPPTPQRRTDLPEPPPPPARRDQEDRQRSPLHTGRTRWGKGSGRGGDERQQRQWAQSSGRRGDERQQERRSRGYDRGRDERQERRSSQGYDRGGDQREQWQWSRGYGR